MHECHMWTVQFSFDAAKMQPKFTVIQLLNFHQGGPEIGVHVVCCAALWVSDLAKLWTDGFTRDMTSMADY